MTTHPSPSVTGLPTAEAALLAAPVVLLVDAIEKRWRHRRREPPLWPTA